MVQSNHGNVLSGTMTYKDLKLAAEFQRFNELTTLITVFSSYISFVVNRLKRTKFNLLS